MRSPPRDRLHEQRVPISGGTQRLHHLLRFVESAEPDERPRPRVEHVVVHAVGSRGRLESLRRSGPRHARLGAIAGPSPGMALQRQRDAPQPHRLPVAGAVRDQAVGDLPAPRLRRQPLAARHPPAGSAARGRRAPLRGRAAGRGCAGRARPRAPGWPAPAGGATAHRRGARRRRRSCPRAVVTAAQLAPPIDVLRVGGRQIGRDRQCLLRMRRGGRDLAQGFEQHRHAAVADAEVLPPARRPGSSRTSSSCSANSARWWESDSARSPFARSTAPTALFEAATLRRSEWSSGAFASNALSMSSAAWNRSRAPSSAPCSSSTEPMLLLADASSVCQSTLDASMATRRVAIFMYSRKCTSASSRRRCRQLTNPTQKWLCARSKSRCPSSGCLVRQAPGERERLEERRLGLGEPPLRDAHVADSVQGGRPLRQLVVAQRRLRNGGEVVHRLRTHIVEDLEPSHLLELLPQVAEHEADQAFCLLPPLLGLAARLDGHGAFGPQVGEVLHPGQRGQGDRRRDEDPTQAATRLGGNPPQPLERVDGRRPLGGRGAFRRWMRRVRSASSPAGGGTFPRRAWSSRAAASPVSGYGGRPV